MVFDAFRLGRRLQSVPSIAMRRALWREVLNAADPSTAAALVDDLSSQAASGSALGGDALLSLGSLVMHERRAQPAAFSDLSRVAAEDGRPLAALFFRDAPAFKALAPKGRLPDYGPPRPPRFEPPLGFLEAVVRNPSEEVLRRALDQRVLPPRFVALALARRPTTPALLWEVMRRDEWLTKPQARSAFVANPFAPTGWTLPLIASTRAAWPLLEPGTAHPLLLAMVAALTPIAPSSAITPPASPF